MAEGGAGGAGGAGGGDAGGAGEKAPGRKGDIGDGVDLDQILPVNVGRLKMYEVGKQIGSGKFSVVFRARTRGVDGKQENVHVSPPLALSLSMILSRHFGETTAASSFFLRSV